MNRQETIQWLIHKRMEARAKLEFFKIADPAKYRKELDILLDRLNDIDKILKELDKEK